VDARILCVLPPLNNERLRSLFDIGVVNNVCSLFDESLDDCVSSISFCSFNFSVKFEKEFIHI